MRRVLAAMFLTLVASSAQGVPYKTRDLFALDVQYTSVLLRWTAQGNQVTGEAPYRYRFFYSTNPITQENYLQATEVSTGGWYLQLVSGEVDTGRVGGLTPGTRYYFAMTTSCVEVGGESVLSIPECRYTRIAPATVGVFPLSYPPLVMGNGINLRTNDGWPIYKGNGVVRDSAVSAFASYSRSMFSSQYGLGSRSYHFTSLGKPHQAVKQENPNAGLILHGSLAAYTGWGESDLGTWRALAEFNRAILYHKTHSTCEYGGWSGSSCCDGCTTGNVNMGAQDTLTGEYVMGELAANLIAGELYASGTDGRVLFGGVWIDNQWQDGGGYDAWNGDSVNIVLAGATSRFTSPRVEFWARYGAGLETFHRALRKAAPTAWIGGNGTPPKGWNFDASNGWTQEAYPSLSGGNAYLSMFQPRHGSGYGSQFYSNAFSGSPYSMSIISNAVDRSAGLDATGRKAVRWSLGMACVRDGWAYLPGTIGGLEYYSSTYPPETYPNGQRLSWAWDEGWVGSSGSALAEPDPSGLGWLGAPLGKAQWYFSDGGPTLELFAATVADSSFESGTAGWSLGQTNGTVTRVNDANAPSGSWCMKANTTTIDAARTFYNTNLYWNYTTGRTPVASGEWLIARFWMKSSSPLPFSVWARDTVGQTWGNRSEAWSDTTWREYLIPLGAGSGTKRVTLNISFGDTMGTWWVDGVHLYQGDNVVILRDFENGRVIVNPSSSATRSIVTGRAMRRIYGATGATRAEGNDGGQQQAVSIPAADAVFLVSPEWTPYVGHVGSLGYVGARGYVGTHGYVGASTRWVRP